MRFVVLLVGAIVFAWTLPERAHPPQYKEALVNTEGTTVPDTIKAWSEDGWKPWGIYAEADYKTWNGQIIHRARIEFTR